MKCRVECLLLLFSLAALPGYADFTTGMTAYDQGNFVEALEEFRPLAQSGNPDAQYRLGLMYAHGRGVDQDYAEAAEWYGKAAAQEHGPSRTNLGSLYFHGWGVERDLEEARRWYSLAADQGRAVAQTNLGRMYELGEGVEADPARAASYYLLAAEQGHAEAQFALGLLYEAGRGVPQNDKKAARWFLKAAKQDHADAQHSLAGLFAEGRGVKQNATKASDWYRAAAANGNAEAQNNLSAFYASRGDLALSNEEPPEVRQGELEPNPREVVTDTTSPPSRPAPLPPATVDRSKSSQVPTTIEPPAPSSAGDVQIEDIRDPDLLYERGRQYATGQGGVAKDEREAIRWYRQAAERGHDLAGYRVALLYLRGRGVEAPDLLQAHLWFSISARRGVGDAADWRDRIGKKLTQSERAESKRLFEEYLGRAGS